MAIANVNVNLDQATSPVIHGVGRFINILPVAIVVLVLGVIAARIIAHLVRFGLSLTKLPKGLRSILVSLTDVALWVFLGIALLQFLGLNNVALAVSGSFAFIVLGLSQGGAQLVSDLLSGVSLAQDRDFCVGDTVKLEDKEIEGMIEELDIRRTRIRDKDGKLHVVPNSVVERGAWVVLDRTQTSASRTSLAGNFKKSITHNKGRGEK